MCPLNEDDLEIRDLWRRALSSIGAAETLLLGGHPDFAASRAYYAAFYSASALLLSAGKKARKHTGVIGLIHKDYVKEGKLPADVGRTLDSLHDLRNLGDYGGSSHVAHTAAVEAIALARRFVEAVRPMVEVGQELH